MFDKSHGSPYDRGAADAYYGRRKDPHKRETDLSPDTPLTDEEEIRQYMEGYNKEFDRKNYCN